MSNRQLGSDVGYVKGHVSGEDTVLIQDTPEQISAFIVKYRMEEVLITDVFDRKLIVTSMGFLIHCLDQKYLASTLLPVLVPMQRGEVKPPKFKPHQL